MAVLISCIAVPSFAGIPGRVFDVTGREYVAPVNQSLSVWTGKKWIKDGKLRCEYFSIRTRDGYSQKHYYDATSFDGGKSPMCGKDQVYDWFEWHMGDWAWASWLGYVDTPDYQEYKHVDSYINDLKHSKDNSIILKRDDGVYVQVSKNGFIDYMIKVRSGLPQDYNVFLSGGENLNPYSVNDELKTKAGQDTNMAKIRLKGIHAPMPWKQKE